MNKKRFSMAAWTVLLPLLTLCLVASPNAANGKPIAIAEIKHDGMVDFQKEVLPILQRNCLACHNAAEAESDLILETPQTILKGGAEGPSVVPGKGAESMLLKLASHQDEPFMPPLDNSVKAKALTPQELGLIKLWIDQGAKGGVVANEEIVFEKLPLGVNPIYAVAISPDGQYVAAGRANQVFIYHLPSKREVGRLTDPELIKSGLYKSPGIAHLDLIQSLVFSPDSRTLASGGYRTVKLWSRAQNARLAELKGLEGPAQSMAISADGKLAAFGEQNGSIKVLELASGKLVQTLKGHGGPVSGVAFSGDGTKLISGSQDKTIRLWNTADGKQIAEPVETPAPVNAVAFVSGDKQVATGNADNMIRIWELPGAAKPAEEAKEEPKEGEAKEGPKPIKELKGHSGPVTALASVGADGAQLLSGSQDATVRHWNVAGGNILRQMSHGGPVVAVSVRADAKRFASASSNNTAKLWNAADGKQVAELKGDFRAKLSVEGLARAVAIANKHIANAKADLAAANKRKTAEDANLKKAEEAKKKADAALKTKVEAAKKPVADKEAADKALEAVKPEVPKAEEAKKKGDADATAAAAAQKKAQADQTAATKVSTDAAKVATDGAKAATASAKAATDATKVATDAAKAVTDATKAATDATKAATDAANAAKKAADDLKKAQDAAKADPDKKELADAVKAAEAAAKEAEDKNKAAAEAKTKADKVAIDATAAKTKADTVKKAADTAKKAADTAKTNADTAKTKADTTKTNADTAKTKADTTKTKADTAKTAADTAKTKADAVKKAADTALTAAQNKLKAAEASVKKLAPVAQKAMDEKNAADRAFKATSRSVTRAMDVLKKATDAVPVADAASKAAEALQKKETATLETAKKAVTESEKPLAALAFSPDGSTLATSGENGIVYTWDSETGAAIDSFTDQGAAQVAIGFTADGNLISAASNNSVIVWDANPEWKLQRVIGSTDSPMQLVDRVTSLAFSPDGKQLATGGGDPSRSGELKIWNLEDGAMVREIKEPHSDSIFGLEFSPDGKFIASCGADRFAKVFVVADGKFEKSFEGHTHHVLGVSWSADGRTLATCGADKVVKVWDFKTGDQKRTISGFGKEVTSIRFVTTVSGANANIVNVVMSCGDKNVYMKRTDNGGNVRNFAGNADFVYNVAISADGHKIVAGGQDSIVRIWLDNGTVLASFEPPAQPDQTASTEGE